MTIIEKIAKASGCTAQAIRVKMQQPDCTFGTAVKNEGSSVYTYIPYPEKVKEYFGVTTDEKENDNHGTGNANECKCSTCRCSDCDKR